ncbi:cation:proton antiporter [Sulfitobacter donghicola]|uniref:Sodium:proton antiporter n=1 Tax=Sulfitobacter donghicola DSW-25 = KCTC 12864 = JCM 14565 TaxID=1300350 RepID=A0A073IDM1_9RHOB|nr:sodium:proton antiporter [Sulfitobacter donghicola]KEJ88453.1 sodium:proton antiporter [Sulfitobacter donghicola DSW-25 = KCTC 12864 = JCM 14565]KIN69677.1 Sodium/hydrogen exchanger [Sulfitobacter donghicola DSW-25 = KCTC 12864 = JCM 14565]
MTFLQITSLLIVLAGGFGAINYLFLKLPSAIGILIVSLLASFVLLGLDLLLPALGIADTVRGIVTGIDFSEALLEGMLGLLLFAGALHVKLSDLRAQWRVVFLMATLGIALSTAIVGIGFSWLTGMPLLVALVFGALISPTDPVAVLGVLREADLPKALETKIAGESLFNDGVGYVVFLVLVGLAFPHGDAHGHGGDPVTGAVILFFQEAIGGAVLGIVLGWLTFRVMRRIDDYPLEVLLTLGLAFGGYELAVWLHVSAPIMAVCAGLLIGDVGTAKGMSEQTRAYVDGFWELIDEILNAVLFLLIGFEVFAIAFDDDVLLTAIAAIALALLARFVAVYVPITLLRPFRSFNAGVVPIMTWGGLKGGISVALALSLPDGEWKPLILTCTYVVVIFSIIVQGLTVARLANRVGRAPDMM